MVTDTVVSKFKKVAVIMGGYSAEREISFLSGNAVLQSLTGSGVIAYGIDPKVFNLFLLKEQGFDCAIIMLHGVGGEDGSIQGLLEYMQIPYSGASVMASAISLDKYKTKLIWKNFDIPMAKDQYLLKKDYQKNEFKLKINLPIIVKPIYQGSTIGITKVYDMNSLYVAIDIAFEYDNAILLEELIIGDEFTATIFNDDIYPLVKIEVPNGDYDYNNKYFTDNTVYICPYRLDMELEQKINNWVKIAYNSIGMSGVARVDFMLDKNKNIYFLEINTIPGMTNHSLVPLAFKESGYSFDQLCLQILADAKLHLRFIK